MKKIVVIGNGKMAIECLKIMQAYQQAQVLLVIADPRDIALMFLKRYCTVEDLNLHSDNNVNSLEILGKIEEIRPDIIFNINSFQIIKSELIAIPSGGIINFHNGPLPYYRGVNVCSWAIINGEKRYGVSWHYVDKLVDTGDIVAQKYFNISDSETAGSLMLKCIDQGILLFKEFFPLVIKGNVKGVSQGSYKTSHYKRKDVPNDGLVNYEWDFEQFNTFIRSLDFDPIPNNFIHPKSYVKSREFYFRKIVKSSKCVSGSINCGQVLGINESGVDVKIGDSVIRIVKILNDKLVPMKISRFADSYNFDVGDSMWS